MLKLTKLDTKGLKLSFAMFEDTVKTYTNFCAFTVYGFTHEFSPVNQTNRFLMVSFLSLLRSLLVNILKQLFNSGSVNIVE